MPVGTVKNFKQAISLTKIKNEVNPSLNYNNTIKAKCTYPVYWIEDCMAEILHLITFYLTGLLLNSVILNHL